MNQEEDLLSAVRELVDAHFSDLRRTVRKNLARLTCAFLHLAWSIRFGYGGLHLTSIARVLPQGKKFKSSYKWLSRFLKCKYFDASSLAECMLAVILGQKPPSWVIVLLDETTVNGVDQHDHPGRGLLSQDHRQHALGQTGSVKVLTFQEAREPFIAAFKLLALG